MLETCHGDSSERIGQEVPFEDNADKENEEETEDDTCFPSALLRQCSVKRPFWLIETGDSVFRTGEEMAADRWLSAYCAALVDGGGSRQKTPEPLIWPHRRRIDWAHIHFPQLGKPRACISIEE